MMQLPNGSGWPWIWMKTGEDGSYGTARVSPDERCGQCGSGFVPQTILKSWQLCLSFKLDVLTS